MKLESLMFIHKLLLKERAEASGDLANLEDIGECGYVCDGKQFTADTERAMRAHDRLVKANEVLKEFQEHDW